MRRISRDTVRSEISVALAVLPSYMKRSLGVNDARVRLDVVENLTQRIMGRPESETVVLRPNMVGNAHSLAHGVWGVDEPHPCPDLKPER